MAGGVSLSPSVIVSGHVCVSAVVWGCLDHILVCLGRGVALVALAEIMWL